jgi:hypothetical protein
VNSSRIRRQLAELAEWQQLLGEHLEPKASGGPRVTGTRERPLPLRVDVLDLSMPARLETVNGREDQVGLPSIASTLASWVDDWIAIRGQHEHMPRQTVTALADWLDNRLDWAAEHHPAFDDFADEIRRLHSQTRVALEITDPRPQLCVGVPCRHCDLLALFRRSDGSGDVECGACGTLLRPDEYREWTMLVAAQHAA